MSFKGRVAKVLGCTAVAVFLLNGTSGLAYDPDKFPGKGSRADWEKACALANQGVELSRLGKHNEAQDRYKRSLALYPTAATCFCYAKDLKRSRRIEEAVEKFERAIDLAPDYYQAYSEMADAYLIQKKYAKAEFACKEALRINPRTAGAMINLAEACMGSGRLSEAKKWLDNASKCPDAMTTLCQSALKADYEKLRTLSKVELRAGD